MSGGGAVAFVLIRDHTVHRFHPSWCVRCDVLLDSDGWAMTGPGTWRLVCPSCQAINEMVRPREMPRGAPTRKRRRSGGPSLMDRMAAAAAARKGSGR